MATLSTFKRPWKKRRILDEIQIDAVACVDRPAQEGALVRIMKRAAPNNDDDEDNMANNNNGDDADNGDDDGNGPLYPNSQHSGSHRNMRDSASGQHSDNNPIQGRITGRSRQHPFDALTDKIARTHNLPRHVAMAHARRRRPDLADDYNETSAYMTPKLNKAAINYAKRAQLFWETEVDNLSRQMCIDKCAASAMLRQARPDLFAQYQNSVVED